MDIKKVVQLTNEQYEELLKNGQVEVNGEIKTKEDGTVYVCPTSESWAELNNKIDEVLIRPNKVYHEQIITKDLETQYEQITTEYTTIDLKKLSCVGFKAFLTKNDVIKTNNAYLFINGTKVDYDYTCTSEDNELVTVFYFEKDGTLNLNENISFIPYEILVKTKETAISINDNYYSYTTNVIVEDTILSGAQYGTKKTKVSNKNGVYYNTLGTNVQEVYSDCEQIGGKNEGQYHLTGKTLLQKAVFPNLVTIAGNTPSDAATGFSGCTNKNLKIEFPKLKTITARSTQWCAPFYEVYQVVLPPSLETISGCITTKNSIVILNCKNATFSSNWCNETPKISFDMCEDWQTTINIKVAGASSALSWYQNLIKNKLAVVEAEALTVPTNIFNQLNTTYYDEEQTMTWVQYGASKGWTIGG